MSENYTEKPMTAAAVLEKIRDILLHADPVSAVMPITDKIEHIKNERTGLKNENKRLKAESADLQARYARLEEALQLIADGKADEWVDSRSKYTRWIGYPGGAEIIRQAATMVLRDIDEPDATDFWLKKNEA